MEQQCGRRWGACALDRSRSYAAHGAQCHQRRVQWRYRRDQRADRREGQGTCELFCFHSHLTPLAKARFDITLMPDSLHFVFLESRWLVEDRAWPRFTLLGQSLGSMYLAWEAMSKFVPDLYVGELLFLPPFHCPFLNCRRYHGVCIHLPCRRVACRYPYWCICALSNH